VSGLVVDVAESSLVGLRRAPKQDRSRARVDAIVTALVELVGERAPSQLTTTDVAERAGVPIGSLYEYFEDLPSIVDAAVARMLDRHDELLVGREGPPPSSAHEFVDTLFDAYLALYREQPGFLTLRNSTLFEAHHRQWLIDRVEGFLADAGAEAAARGVLGRDLAADRRLGLLMAAGDAMLQRVFRDDPAGDAVLIAESRVVLKFMADRLAVDPG
jgi:AcrR family transcriptional regulator